MLIFVVVSVALFMSTLDQTIVATALHALQQGLHASINWAGWTITIYSLAMVVALPLTGALSDRYGRRRVFLVAVVVFSTASLCCGLTNSVYLLVGLRAVQAFGGAAFTPSATGIVVDYAGEARDRAVGLFGSVFSIGAIVGPVVGGVFVAYWSWRGIFLVNVPIGLAVIVLGLRCIPRDEPHQGGRAEPFDVVGMALLAAGVVMSMLGISYLGEAGARVSSWPFVAPVTAGLLALAVFVRHTHRTQAPFIAPRLLYGRGFASLNSINFLYGGGAFGLGTLIPLYATERYGIRALDSGLVLSGRGVSAIVVTWLATVGLRRTGYRWPLFIGFLVMAGGTIAVAARPVVMSPYAWLVTAGVITGVGMGMSGPASRNAALQLAPREAAAIAGLRTTCREAGSIIGISITTAIVAAAANPGVTQGHVFAVFGLLLLAAAPVVVRVPEHRGSW